MPAAAAIGPQTRHCALNAAMAATIDKWAEKQSGMNNHFNKRGRNNHQRRRQGVNPNRALDSNGPDVRIRGTAQQIYDKYQALARDATSSGDRVKAENYLQHAEHYFRVLRATQGPQAQPFDQSSGDADFDGDQPSISNDRDMREQRQQTAQSDAGDTGPETAELHVINAAADDGDGAPPEPRAQDMRPQGGDQEGRRRRRRPRRPREDGAPDEPAVDDVEPVTAG